MGLLQAIPRVFTVEADPDSLSVASASVPPTPAMEKQNGTVGEQPLTNLAPELRTRSSNDTPTTRSKMDFVFTVKSIRLNLYNGEAVRESDFKDTGIVRFALNDNIVRAKMLADGALEAEIVLQTFTVTNTRPGRSRFREVIPAEKNREQAQVMILYSSSGSSNPSPQSYAVITVDSPKILFALDPAFALLSFFTSAFPAQPPVEAQTDDQQLDEKSIAPTSPAQPQSGFAFRFDLHDASITILEDDEQINSQALRLSINHISISQQVSHSLPPKIRALTLDDFEPATAYYRIDNQAARDVFTDNAGHG